MNYAHGNMLTDEEFDLIAASRGTLSITPSTDMLMQFGTFPGTGPALQRGIVCGFGVDTICSAGTDLFSEMRLALAAERSRANAAALARGERVPTVELHQRDMLRLATLDGARVWSLRDEIGSLTPGKQADIAILDMRSPHLDGFGDPVAVMVLGAGPADVETVIVGGDIVKRDGQLVGAHVDARPNSSCTRPRNACAARTSHQHRVSRRRPDRPRARCARPAKRSRRDGRNRSATVTDTLGVAGGAVASSAADVVRYKEVVATMLSGPDRIKEVVRDAELPFAPEALRIDAASARNPCDP